jgi:hypothetical protein
MEFMKQAAEPAEPGPHPSDFALHSSSMRASLVLQEGRLEKVQDYGNLLQCSKGPAHLLP